MPLTTKLLAQLSATQTGANDFGGPTFNPRMQQLITLIDGTTAGAANLAFFDQRAVASATNDDIDFAGVLTDAFGVTFAAAELVALFIINAPISGAANTTNLTLGQGSSNPILLFGGTSPTRVIKPGGFLFMGESDATGLATVTAGSADTLRIANGSGAVNNYQIGVIARNA
jgi:hypothetical protein